MIDHLGIFVSDPARSFPFYENVLAPLGILVRERNPHWGSIIMSGERRRPFLFIGPAGGDYHGTEVRIAERRPVHLAFRAPSKEAVDAFH
jgi:catechol 2,3-dioxygenase-like lactoylglutathione lyase family enzyme